jgi:hypothetical protein
MVIRVLILICLVATSARATTHIIQADGSGDFPTIQDAMFASDSGDTILLGNGVFMGSASAFTNLTVKSISDDPTATVVFWGFQIMMPSVGETRDFHIEGVTIHASILASGNVNLFIRNIRQTDNSVPCVEGSGLLRIVDSLFSNCEGHFCATEVTISNCTIENYRNDDIFQGVALVENTVIRSSGHSYAFINSGIGGTVARNCTFIDNTAYIFGGGGMTFWNCIFTNCSFESNVNAGTFFNCAFYRNGDVDEYFAANIGMNGNVLANPAFCGPAEGDLTICAESPCAPGNSGVGLIGAQPVGCSGCNAVATQSVTFGSLKSLFR